MAKLEALIMLLIGFVIGIFVGIVAALGANTTMDLSGLPFSPWLLVIIMPFFYAIIYGLVGLVFGALGAWLYNVVSKWVGGIRLELEK